MKLTKQKIIMILVDAVLIFFALYISLFIRFDGIIPEQFMNSFLELIPIFTVVSLACFYFTGLYNRLWQYASIGDLLTVIYGVSSSVIINIAFVYFLVEGGKLPLPRSVFILNWVFAICLIGGARLIWRLFKDHSLTLLNNKSGKHILIVGAGDSGVLVAKELKRHFNGEINLIGFVDDDPAKQNLKVLSFPVLGDRHSIVQLVERHKVQEIILAIPSAKGKEVRDILSICQETNAVVKILPGMHDLIEGKVTVNHIREVQIEDLLGREQIKVDLESISQYLNDHVVLVTGAGGSIGSELCRQIANFSPKQLLLLDNCENNIYDIELELKSIQPIVEIVPLVKDIRDKEAIEQVFNIFKPHVVFHAAAHKHVPLMEINAEEAFKNNVIGTYNVAKAADLFGIKKFVLISTDKAVNPVNIMGATKRIAEMVIQYFDKISTTNYVAVRFGNVLGSRGSVVPLFKKQIAEGGPVTVTHPDMVRYFMTIPEAVELVIQAGAMANGGEIFILDMGEPVKIVDLANTLIRLSGLEPENDIEIVFTGTRPGERLYEELLTAEEGINATTHERIFVAKPNGLNIQLIEETIYKINKGIIPKNKIETENYIIKFIPGYKTIENNINNLDINNYINIISY
ncbi:MAG: polysaccharide biosynthesis protein [Bacillota bacterium]